MSWHFQRTIIPKPAADNAVLGAATVNLACTDATWDLGTSQAGVQAPKLCAALGLDQLALVSQVHGSRVVEAQEALASTQEADALVTTHKQVGLTIRVADCLPVLFWDSQAGIVGAAHAGRVGLFADVLPHTVAAMKDLGANQICAWIGPHICGQCYEVSQEMWDQTKPTHPLALATSRNGLPALDLVRVAVDQLQNQAVKVCVDNTCTLESRHLHSYRRDGQSAGRLAAVVWMS